MSTSIFIARLLGPVLIVVGVAFTLKPQTYRLILEDFNRSPAALLYLVGFLGLLSGLALVQTHNVWALDWGVVVTLIGWLWIVRAAAIIFAPEYVMMLGSKIVAGRRLFFGATLVDLMFGLFLSYFGYVG